MFVHLIRLWKLREKTSNRRTIGINCGNRRREQAVKIHSRKKSVMKIINFAVTTVANWNRFYYIRRESEKSQDVINSNCSYLMHPCTPRNFIVSHSHLPSVSQMYVPPWGVCYVPEKMKMWIILRGGWRERRKIGNFLENSYFQNIKKFLQNWIFFVQSLKQRFFTLFADRRQNLFFFIIPHDFAD